MRACVIAIDWGSTHRRSYALAADGCVLARRHDALGITAKAPIDYAAEMASVRADLGDLPVLAAGMIGSAAGWVTVPYLPCPAGLDALAASFHWVERGRTAIVPGLCRGDGHPADVMRGEEVQLLGAVAAGLVPPTGLICQPGTHCKWARMAGGAVADFRTRMTGELFALLQQHSLLSPMMTASVVDGPAFRAGVSEAQANGASSDLLAALFGVRAGVLRGQRPAEDGAAYASGLLIGSDVGAQQLVAGEVVHLLADAGLGALYSAAIAATGAVAVRVDSEAAFTAGAAALFSRAGFG